MAAYKAGMVVIPPIATPAKFNGLLGAGSVFVADSVIFWPVQQMRLDRGLLTMSVITEYTSWLTRILGFKVFRSNCMKRPKPVSEL